MITFLRYLDRARALEAGRDMLAAWGVMCLVSNLTAAGWLSFVEFPLFIGGWLLFYFLKLNIAERRGS